jgi:hypothetical protein
MASSTHLLSAAFIAFVVAALAMEGHAHLFTASGPLVAVTLTLWAPAFAFANLVTLLYFAMHFDALVARFLS